MCGYLPFANHFEDITSPNDNETDDDDDPFSRSDDEADDDDDVFFEKAKFESNKQDLPTQAVAFLRDEIDLDGSSSMVYRNIPIFLGHGTEDDKVPIDIGREAIKCLKLLEADVRIVEYEGLGHWYSPEMLEDIFSFLKEKLASGG